MLKRKNLVGIGMLVLLVCLNIACDSQQMEEANKLINEANPIAVKANDTGAKAESLVKELLGANLTNAEDMEHYKSENKAKFDEGVSLSEQTEKSLNEAAAKFEQASKLKVNDKFKEYLGYKAQDIKKRAEGYKGIAALFKSVLAETDEQKAGQLVTEGVAKYNSTIKDADDLDAKAQKIVKDNPDLFKK